MSTFDMVLIVFRFFLWLHESRAGCKHNIYIFVLYNVVEHVSNPHIQQQRNNVQYLELCSRQPDKSNSCSPFSSELGLHHLPREIFSILAANFTMFTR